MKGKNMKTFLKDLNVSQLDWLLKNNRDFRNMVEEYYIENVTSWIKLLNYLNGCTEIEDDYLKEQLDIMLDSEQFEDYYILGDDLSKIYFDIAYTITLK